MNRRRQLLRHLAALVAGLLGAGMVAAPQANAGSAATAVTAVTCDVTTAMTTAAAYWVAHGTDTASNDWQNSTFHVGNLAMVRTTGVSNHVTLPWAQANGYDLQTGPNPFFPDYEAAGEAYLALQYFHPDPTTLAPLQARVDAEVASVHTGQDRYWNYVDALNMAMPSFAQLGVMNGSSAELDAMHTLFEYTKSHLFDQRTGLWWRDAHYAHTNVFWSRGNGWAIAALAKVLSVLPATDPHRAEYLGVYRRMAVALLHDQRRDGFWNVDLNNPFDHPGPETSGTALFTYALAWGVNNGVLPARVYTPVVRRAWHGMATEALRPSGLLGYVQGVASGPWGAQPVTADDTAAYGVGVFLLAGQQV
ncbi:MAG TPA: glycoside hydrolase family 88 protein, partial [Pseudonocardiaceae bacterium]|nr:glycoside hydrolase family 88 protein [Pseudonocardiaceae bacterium]